MSKEYYVPRAERGSVAPPFITDDLEEAREATLWVGYGGRIMVREVSEWELLETWSVE